MAQWEAERGYRSTYFILHTAPYWQDKDTLQASLEVIADCGHEIGFHINAITKPLIGTGRDPLEIAAEAVGELRGYGYEVHGVVPTATKPATSPPLRQRRALHRESVGRCAGGRIVGWPA
jgi:hypothetical protein